MKKAILALSFAVMVLAGAGFVQAGAGDAGRGAALAKGCRCHGTQLNGWPADKVVKALNDFKNDKRINKFMNKKAKTLSEQDIADLAAYYSTKE